MKKDERSGGVTKLKKILQRVIFISRAFRLSIHYTTILVTIRSFRGNVFYLFVIDGSRSEDYAELKEISALCFLYYCQ